MNFNMSPSKIGVGGSLSAIATAAIGYVLQGKNLITRKAATVFYAASALLALISIGTAAWKSRTVTQQKPTPLEVAVQKAKDCIAAIKEENIFTNTEEQVQYTLLVENIQANANKGLGQLASAHNVNNFKNFTQTTKKNVVIDVLQNIIEKLEASQYKTDLSKEIDCTIKIFAQLFLGMDLEASNEALKQLQILNNEVKKKS